MVSESVSGHFCCQVYNSPAIPFRFNEDFDGMLLAYDVCMADQKMKMLFGVYPYSGVTIKANLLLFSPKPDMLLGKMFPFFHCQHYNVKWPLVIRLHCIPHSSGGSLFCSFRGESGEGQ